MGTRLNIKDIAFLLKLTPRAVSEQATKDNWPYEHERGNRGRPPKVFKLENLPQEIQLLYKRYNADEKLLAVAMDGAGHHLPPVAHGGGPSPPSQTVTSAVRRLDRGGKALAKHKLVLAYCRAVNRAEWGGKQAAREQFVHAYNTGALHPEIYKQIGSTAWQTVEEWKLKLKRNNNDPFILTDTRGGYLRGRRCLTDDAKTALLRCYLHPTRPSMALAIRATHATLQKNNTTMGGSDSTARRWLRDYVRTSGHVVTMARDGLKAYTDEWAPYITRDSGVLKPGQALVADGKALNFLIRHPDTGRPCRMTLILFYDWASRCPAGWQIMPTEDTVAIHAAFRAAVINIGRFPAAVYLDNGKAFKAKIFTESDPDLTDLSGLYARLDVAVAFARPYNARSKIVERFFLTMQEQMERLMPTYTGASIDDKPAWMLRNEKLHAALHDAHTQGWTPNIREAGYIVAAYCKWFSRQPHRGLGGRRPVDVLNDGRGPGVDTGDLNQLFMWRIRKKPRRCRIRLWGIDYEADCLHGIGQDVVVHYDTANLAQVHLYNTRGIYLGDALPVQALHPLARLFGDEVAVDQVKRAIARQKRMAKQVERQMLEQGVSRADVDALGALPYNRKMIPLTSGKPETAPTDVPALTDAERDHLKLIADRAEAEMAADREPHKVPRPEVWAGELERYEWAWRAKFERKESIAAVDEAFMTYFEQTDEFKNNYADRFADLKMLYS